MLGSNRKLHNEPVERKKGAGSESGLVRAAVREDGFVSLSQQGGGALFGQFRLN